MKVIVLLTTFELSKYKSITTDINIYTYDK